ncbi:MAG: flagellar motor switch protein FliG [Spirochaetaceae bacterium]|nr:MAG: flagellar motor switch protein FliG [Spirochaetaceae bacterium]
MLIGAVDLNKQRADAYRKTQSPKAAAGSPETAPGGSSAANRRDVERQARAVSALVKVGSDGARSERGVKKVARFLMAVGKDEAAVILRHLDESEIEAVLREITAVSRLGREEAGEILAEFGRAVRQRRLEPQGGADVAHQMLEQAFGSDVAEKIFSRVVPQPAARAFAFLEDLEPQQLMVIAKEESPAAIALILAHLTPASASEVISRLSDEVRQEVLLRIARMQRVDNEVLSRVEESLREKIRSHGRVVTQEVDGMATLARILRTMGAAEGGEVMRALRQEEPDIYDEIQDRLFTIETLLLIEDTDLQRVLRDFSDRDIAVILKGKSEDIRAKVLRNVSERRRSIIADEYAHLGPLPRTDVDRASSEFIDYLRRLEDSGELLVRHQDEEYI